MQEEAPSIRNKLDKFILENIRGTERPREIFLTEDEFLQFRNEVEPIYKKQYGSLLASGESEYENILYKGIPVCLKK